MKSRLIYEDRSVNRLLGLDENREAALALCRVKGRPRSPLGTQSPEDLPEAVKNASRVSPREFDEPEVLRVHAAGYDIMTGKTVFNMCRALGIEREARISMPTASLPDADLGYPEAVFRRRSGRNFVAETLSLSQLRSLLRVVAAMGGHDHNRSLQTVCTGFLTRGVASLTDGFYVMDEEGLGLVRTGAFTGPMSRICLNQEWMAGASLHFLFMTHMNSLWNGHVGAEGVSVCRDDRRPHGRTAIPGGLGIGFGLLRYRRILRWGGFPSCWASTPRPGSFMWCRWVSSNPSGGEMPCYRLSSQKLS